mmetsp:Transcript_24922/g.59181  ORF Transcript_24922/g.59181 Transcript_24922/m.59181 type:complete len:96 (-) Transcript_24922:3247-3534(-)
MEPSSLATISIARIVRRTYARTSTHRYCSLLCQQACESGGQDQIERGTRDSNHDILHTTPTTITARAIRILKSNDRLATQYNPAVTYGVPRPRAR